MTAPFAVCEDSDVFTPTQAYLPWTDVEYELLEYYLDPVVVARLSLSSPTNYARLRARADVYRRHHRWVVSNMWMRGISDDDQSALIAQDGVWKRLPDWVWRLVVFSWRFDCTVMRAFFIVGPLYWTVLALSALSVLLDVFQLLIASVLALELPIWVVLTLSILNSVCVGLKLALIICVILGLRWYRLSSEFNLFVQSEDYWSRRAPPTCVRQIRLHDQGPVVPDPEDVLHDPKVPRFYHKVWRIQTARLAMIEALLRGSLAGFIPSLSLLSLQDSILSCIESECIIRIYWLTVDAWRWWVIVAALRQVFYSLGLADIDNATTFGIVSWILNFAANYVHVLNGFGMLGAYLMGAPKSAENLPNSHDSLLMWYNHSGASLARVILQTYLPRSWVARLSGDYQNRAAVACVVLLAASSAWTNPHKAMIATAWHRVAVFIQLTTIVHLLRRQVVPWVVWSWRSTGPLSAAIAREKMRTCLRGITKL